MRSLWHIVILVLITIALLLLYEVYLLPPKTYSEGELIIIRKKLTTSQIAHLLKDKGIIQHPKRFVLLAQILGFEKKLKNGRYLFKKDIDELEVLKRIKEGPSYPIFVTIPEGMNLREIASLLEREAIISEREFLSTVSDPSLLKSFRIQGISCEGYLFPDTYDFPLESEPKEVINKMLENFFRVYREIGGNPDSSLKEIVILASLIEKETGVDSERPIIASVFLNRLKKNLPLECDPTIQYILKKHKERITYKDLKIPSPYNTYLHPGLPPGPICNPGKKSLKAALFPERTDYLYFVAKGDGSHHFSLTLSEHIRFKKSLKGRVR